MIYLLNIALIRRSLYNILIEICSVKRSVFYGINEQSDLRNNFVLSVFIAQLLHVKICIQSPTAD